MNKVILSLLLTLLSQMARPENIEIEGIIYNVDMLEETASVVGWNNTSEMVNVPDYIAYEGMIYPVIQIKEWAFGNLEKMESIEIGNNIQEIGEKAFWGCVNLTSVKLPDNLTVINKYIFYGCRKLTEIKIPKSVERVGSYAFYGCYSLKHLYIYSNNVPNTNESAFDGAWINNATLHVPYESVETYGKAEPWRYFKNIVAIRIIGDANGDGIVDTKDINAVANYIMKGESVNGFNFVNADTNSDAKVNIIDIVAITNLIMNK